MWSKILHQTLIGAAIAASVQSAEARLSSTHPVPEDVTTIEAQLKRFRGQTRFLNAVRSYRGEPPRSGEKADQRSGAGGARAQQESDVFKIGKPGSKLLYLLNHYRGLQVVSYVKGAEQPELIGRVDPSGNHPTDMYQDVAHDRLIVLERADYDKSSSILAYDVRDAKAPRIAQTIEIEGDIADSRIVGDVLYVSTTSYSLKKGMVYSFKLLPGSIELVQKQKLALPVSRRENMNIVEVKDGAKFKYYLLAVLSESGWGWWDRSNLVEVVDISSARGEIRPIMTVSAKGNIAERSQTTIKNGTLIVTSNYRTSQTRDGLMRVAVETFGLPVAESETISENEAQFRKLWIERETAKLHGEEKDRKVAELSADSKLGLKGRFVRTTDGGMRKILPDDVVTVGDTQGLHANLRDVRYEGDYLYAFWVPQNEIDPFDLFDISQPENGIRYIKRLHFDGWIDRAIPMNYQGRRFVLGLGWNVLNVNNETRRRAPQAMLFEVIEKNGSARAVEVGQLVLDGSRIWTDFNEADRFIEVRTDADGTGSVLFKAYQNEGRNYQSGGKVIAFDLNQAISDNDEKVFREGSLTT